MTLITASERVQIKHTAVTKILVAERDYLTKPMNTDPGYYEIRRLGRKDYGVFVKGQPSWARIIQRYACSHLEARRRWAMVLVTKRLCAN